jgi:hypothetical protein
MFGLDLISIIAAAIGGGIGGALGGLLATIVKAPNVRIALVAGLASVGAVLANPVIRPYVDASIGTSVRGNQFEATYENEVLPEIKKIPALERIFREHPDVEAKFRTKAKEIYEAGGAKALVEQSSAIGALVLGDAFVGYMPRARKEDLIFFAVTMGEVFSTMNEKDPEACIFYQFGATYGKALTPDRIKASIGPDLQKKQIDVMNAVVTNAADKPIPFDDTKATLAVADLSTRHAPELTSASAEVAQGKRPPTDVAEAKIACGFAAALFHDLATMDPDTADLILRKMFSR